SCNQPLRSGSYRALASTANAFARESFMDELAAAAGVDPLEFRLRHLTNDRLRAVLVAVADKFGWKRAWKKNSSTQKSGGGLGCGTEQGSYVACGARIEVEYLGPSLQPCSTRHSRVSVRYRFATRLIGPQAQEVPQLS